MHSYASLKTYDIALPYLLVKMKMTERTRMPRIVRFAGAETAVIVRSTLSDDKDQDLRRVTECVGMQR